MDSQIMNDENIIVWSKNMPLTWDDFDGPIVDDGHMAASFTGIGCEYTEKVISTRTSFKFKIILVVIGGFFHKKKSWKKDIVFTSQEGAIYLLNHEQGHLDLAEECARELRKKVNALTKKTYLCKGKTELERRRNARKKAQELVQPLYVSEYGKLRQLQTKYDNETDHSRIIEKQEIGNKHFFKIRN